MKTFDVFDHVGKFYSIHAFKGDRKFLICETDPAINTESFKNMKPLDVIPADNIEHAKEKWIRNLDGGGKPPVLRLRPQRRPKR